MQEGINRLGELRDRIAAADTADKVVSEFAEGYQWFDGEGVDVLGKHRSELKLVYTKLCLYKFAAKSWKFNECAGWSKHECAQFLSELKKVDRQGSPAGEKERALAVARLFNLANEMKSWATKLYALGMLLGVDSKLTKADAEYYTACKDGKVEFNAEAVSDAVPVADKVIIPSGEQFEPNGYVTLNIASREGAGQFAGEVRIPFSIEGSDGKVDIPSRGKSERWKEVPF